MRIIIRTLLLLLVVITSVSGQTTIPRPDQIEAPAEYLDSKLMGRRMPYGVVRPVHYNMRDHSGRQFPVLYLLHGLTGNFSNWITRADLQKHANENLVIIVTPEGGNGWYTDNLSKDGDKYESYIIRELIPEIDRRFRTMADRDNRSIAGLSMGGFGAIKFGLKYPDMFSLVGSFSGAIAAAGITEKEFPGAIGKTITSIFGPAGGEIRKANDPFDIVRRASPDKIKTLPFIYLDCGTEDFLFLSNQDFAKLLVEKKVRHEFRQLPGSHNWEYWASQLEEFMRARAKYAN